MQTMKSITALCLTTAFATGTMIAKSAFGQESYPSKSVRIVVASEAGSTPDILARAIALEMAPLLKATIIIENRPGAAGTIGAASVASALPDGYTLLMGGMANLTLAPNFYPVKYSAKENFTSIGMVAVAPLLLIANPGLEILNYAQLVNKAKEFRKEAPLSYSSPGIGGPQHMAGRILQQRLGSTTLHVPYKSGGAAVVAVASGEVKIGFVGVPAGHNLVRSNKVHALLVTSEKRIASLPDVPAAGELGLPELQINNWNALFAPAGLPVNIRNALESALAAALKAERVSKLFRVNGAEVKVSSSAELAIFVASEVDRWKTVATTGEK